MRRKICAHVDGGPSGGSSVGRPRSEDPHRPDRIFVFLIRQLYFKLLKSLLPNILKLKVFKVTEQPGIIKYVCLIFYKLSNKCINKQINIHHEQFFCDYFIEYISFLLNKIHIVRLQKSLDKSCSYFYKRKFSSVLENIKDVHRNVLMV